MRDNNLWRKITNNEKIEKAEGIIKGRNEDKNGIKKKEKARQKDRAILNALKKRHLEVYIKEENGEIKSVLFDLK